MKNIKKGIDLNIDVVNYAPITTLKQEDNATLELNLYKDGEEFNITGQTVTLAAKRSDKVIIEQIDGFTINNNTLTINLKNNIIAKIGLVYLELTFKDVEGSMTTLDFNLKVNGKLLGEDSLDASDNIASLEKVKQDFINSSSTLLGDVTKNENIRSEAEKTRKVNEETRNRSETSRTNAETKRVEAEKTRVNQESLRVAAEEERVAAERIRDEKVEEISSQCTKIENDFDEAIANITNGNESATNSEIVQARGGEVNLNKRLDNFDAQLSEYNNNIRDIQVPNNYNGAIAVFTDDDGRDDVIAKWINGICVEKDIKVSISVIANQVGKINFLTVENLKEILNKGNDILDHSFNHINMNTSNLYEIESDLKKSKEFYKNNGLKDPETLVYPWGLNRANETVKNLIRKYYKYALHSSSDFNRIPLDNMWIQRVDLAKKTLEELKSEVSNAYYNNGLIVFYTHSHYPEGDGAEHFPTQKIKDLIDYIKNTRNMPIMTFSEAIKKKGNVIQAGEGSKYDRFFALSYDGTVAMPQNLNIVKDRSWHINTTIVNFPNKFLTVVPVSIEDDVFMHKGGNLFVYRYDENYGFEIFMPNGTNDIYKRNWTYGASNWDSFVDLHPKNFSENITLTLDDLGTLTAGQIKKVQKQLLTNLNLNNYIIIVNPIGMPYNIIWSYGMNYNNKKIEFSLFSPAGTTPSAGINFQISYIPKS